MCTTSLTRVVAVGLLVAGFAILGATAAVPAPRLAAGAPPIAEELKPWLGHWIGPATLELPGKPEPSQKFEMELIVEPTADPARLTWRIVYISSTPAGSTQRQERPYELVAVDADAGRYQVDERNGIVIPTALVGSSLHSCFTVQGNQISASYRLSQHGDEPTLVLELVTTDAQRPSTTGDKDGSPPVIVLGVKSVQRAVMTRAKAR